MADNRTSPVLVLCLLFLSRQVLLMSFAKKWKHKDYVSASVMELEV